MTLSSWLHIARESPFSMANLPFGIISTSTRKAPRPAVAIGDSVLDLAVFTSAGGFSNLHSNHDLHEVFSQPSLNAFAALGQPAHRAVREYLQHVFRDDTPHPEVLKTNERLKNQALIPLSEVQNHLPLEIGDYTDFFAGVNHAFNVGTLFRGPANALQPNYKFLPVAYHSRASSVVVSGTPLRRPWGQVLLDPTVEPKLPTFTPCKRLDIELELAAFVCKASGLGEQINVNQAAEYIFGYVLMNDWSARDIQMWEYVPLGPFNAKNFGTTISAWVILHDALQPFATNALKNDAPYPDYLHEKNPDNVFDINLHVDLISKSGASMTITNSNSKNLMWSFPQMLTHHSVSGCPMRVGDLLGSGTISGLGTKTQGSLLELTDGGKVPIKLDNGEERRFLQDGDSVIIYGSTGEDGARIGFGPCSGTILPALEL